MEVRELVASDNKTVIEVRITEVSAGLFFRRLRVYSASGYAFDIDIDDALTTTIKTIAIEYYPQYFISPYPNTTTGYMRIELEYKSKLYGDWYVYDNQRHEVRYTIRKNSYTAPTVDMTLSSIGLVSGYNMVGTTAIQAAFSGSAKLGASVSSYRLNVDGKSYGSPYKSDPLTSGGWLTVTGTVTDSRGFTASKTTQIWVMDRMPSLDSASGATDYLDGAINYSYKPANKDAYSRLVVQSKVGDSYSTIKTVDIGQASGKKDGSFKIEGNDLVGAYEKYPNTDIVPLRITLQSYKGAYTDKLAEEYSQDLTLKIPQNADTKPQIDGIAVSGSPVLFNTTELFLKGKNGVAVNATAKGKYNASIVSVRWVIEEEEFANGAAADYFATFGMLPITVTAVDTRGFTNSAIKNITVSDYQKPYVSSIAGADRIVVRRADSNGNEDDSGQYLRIEAGKRFKSIDGKNTCTLKYRKKVSGEAWGGYSTLLAANSADNDCSITINEGLDPQTIYVIELSVTDGIGESAVYAVAIATEAVYMDRSGTRNSIAFGGHVTEDNAFEVYWAAYFRGGMYFDDLNSGKRYKVIIGADNIIRAVEEKTTFNLRR